jgi:hypothetical protein
MPEMTKNSVTSKPSCAQLKPNSRMKVGNSGGSSM